MAKSPPYKRILLKLSGEAFGGPGEYGVDKEALEQVTQKVLQLREKGHEIGIVLGGGNIFRGIQKGPSLGIGRTPADLIGMLATLINGIAFKETLTRFGCDVRMMTELACDPVAERYQGDRAHRYLKKGYVVLFAGGTGHPFFTTDTAAALKASEIKADILLKATTHVDGVYDKDPLVYKDAKKYEKISYSALIEQKLGIIDLTAVTLCMSSKIPIKVFNLFAGPLLGALSEEKAYGTLITSESYE